MVPESWLLYKFKTVKFLREPKDVGIKPGDDLFQGLRIWENLNFQFLRDGARELVLVHTQQS